MQMVGQQMGVFTPGRVPAIGGEGRTVLQHLESSRIGQEVLKAQQQSTPALEAELLKTFEGLHRLAKPDQMFDRQAAATMISGSIENIKPFLPLLAQASPELLRMIGPGAEQMVASGNLVQSMYHQGMTADKATELTTALGAQMGFGGTGFRGMGQLEISQMAALGTQQGWGPGSLEAGAFTNWAAERSRGYAAARDVTGIRDVGGAFEMLNKLTLGGVGMTPEQQAMHVRQMQKTGQIGGVGYRHVAGIQAAAGQYAQSIGGEIGFGREAGLGAARFGAAMMRAGGMGENLNLARVDRVEMEQRDAMLRVNARSSRAFGELAATVRLDEELGFKSGTQAKAMVDAIKRGDSSYTFNGQQHDVLGGDWTAIMQAGGVSRNAAVSARGATAANQAYGEAYNVQNIARERQWDEDVVKPLSDRITSGLGDDTAANRARADVIMNTMRDFRAGPNESVIAATKRRHQEVTAALISQGMNPAKAAEAAQAGVTAAESAAQRWNYKSFHEMALASRIGKDERQVAREAEEDAAEADEQAGNIIAPPGERARQTIQWAGRAKRVVSWFDAAKKFLTVDTDKLAKSQAREADATEAGKPPSPEEGAQKEKEVEKKVAKDTGAGELVIKGDLTISKEGDTAAITARGNVAGDGGG
jgi:hypothetical protein